MPFPGILASHLPNTFPCNYLDIEAPVPRVPEFSRCSVSRHRMSIAAPHGYRGTAWVSRVFSCTLPRLQFVGIKIVPLGQQPISQAFSTVLADVRSTMVMNHVPYIFPDDGMVFFVAASCPHGAVFAVRLVCRRETDVYLLPRYIPVPLLHSPARCHCPASHAL